jgi:hypothetical protein
MSKSKRLKLLEKKAQRIELTPDEALELKSRHESYMTFKGKGYAWEAPEYPEGPVKFKIPRV